jgi:molecular chaperone DnaK
MAAVIGIDLGTSFSVVAVIDKTGRPQIVPNKDSNNLTPSCVVQRDRDVMEVGEFARKQWGNAPETAAARFKRDMGTSALYEINGMQFTPTQLSTLVLKKLYADATLRLGPIAEAVVTIPANFAHEAREATLAAAKAAGLNVNFIINEPTAAALYYAFKNGSELNGIYAVYDLGGGTFDISIINVVGYDVEVLATNGISKLGGDDFDLALQNMVARKFKELTGKVMGPDDYTKNDAEADKKSLSLRKRVTARVDREFVDIRRDEFEEAVSSFVTQAEMLCEATVEEANLSFRDIAGTLLVGGSTRIPLIRESVEKLFGKPPITSENADEIVALGAALYSAYKGDKANLSAAQRSTISRIMVTEKTSKCFGTLSLGFNSARNERAIVNTILIPKGSVIPCSVTSSFYTIRDGQTVVSCEVTESTSPETDPRFVKLIWTGNLDLPPGRPSGQEIKVTFAYDENQVMNCSFHDVGTGRKNEIDISHRAAQVGDTSEIDQFLVE